MQVRYHTRRWSGRHRSGAGALRFWVGNSFRLGSRCLAAAAVLITWALGPAALAQDGPHANAYLVPHVALDIEYTASINDYSGMSNVRSCDEISVSAPVSDPGELTPVVWYVLAVFEDSPGPVEMHGITFGIGDYDAASFEIYRYGECFFNHSLELSSPGWPGPNTGTALVGTDQYLSRDTIAEVYWFASYVYGEVEVPLDVNPVQDVGEIGNADEPPTMDRIYAENYGRLGFGRLGYNPCEPLPATGACCFAEECEIVTLDDCAAGNGDYMGDNTTCFPINPCEPAQATSWGNLKRLYNN